MHGMSLTMFMQATNQPAIQPTNQLMYVCTRKTYTGHAFITEMFNTDVAPLRLSLLNYCYCYCSCYNICYCFCYYFCYCSCYYFCYNSISHKLIKYALDFHFYCISYCFTTSDIYYLKIKLLNDLRVFKEGFELKLFMICYGFLYLKFKSKNGYVL